MAACSGQLRSHQPACKHRWRELGCSYGAGGGQTCVWLKWFPQGIVSCWRLILMSVRYRKFIFQWKRSRCKPLFPTDVWKGLCCLFCFPSSWIVPGWDLLDLLHLIILPFTVVFCFLFDKPNLIYAILKKTSVVITEFPWCVWY